MSSGNKQYRRDETDIWSEIVSSNIALLCRRVLRLFLGLLLLGLSFGLSLTLLDRSILGRRGEGQGANSHLQTPLRPEP
jgi:hypothetical protein